MSLEATKLYSRNEKGLNTTEHVSRLRMPTATLGFVGLSDCITNDDLLAEI